MYSYTAIATDIIHKKSVCVALLDAATQLDHCDMDFDIMRAEGAAVKEMEAAGIAWVSQQARVPFIAVKAITDIVDEVPCGPDEFYSNLHAASEALQVHISML